MCVFAAYIHRIFAFKVLKYSNTKSHCGYIINNNNIFKLATTAQHVISLQFTKRIACSWLKSPFEVHIRKEEKKNVVVIIIMIMEKKYVQHQLGVFDAETNYLSPRIMLCSFLCQLFCSVYYSPCVHVQLNILYIVIFFFRFVLLVKSRTNIK